MDPTARDDRLLATTRWTAIVIIPVLVAAFVILYLFPSRTQDLWAWTIRPTMTPMLMGGGYLAGAWFFLRVARTRSGHQALSGLLGVCVFTSMLLGATILHWDRFNHAHVSFWAWFGLYVVTPLLLPVLWFNNRRTDPEVPGPGDVEVPGPVRAAFATVGAVQLLLAFLIFVRPSLAVEHWPWTVTPLTARTISAFLAFPAVTWLLFATDARWSSFEIPVESATIGLALILVATVRASGELRGAAVAYGAALVGALVWLLAVQLTMRRRRRHSTRG